MLFIFYFLVDKTCLVTANVCVHHCFLRHLIPFCELGKKHTLFRRLFCHDLFSHIFCCSFLSRGARDCEIRVNKNVSQLKKIESDFCVWNATEKSYHKFRWIWSAIGYENLPILTHQRVVDGNWNTHAYK